MIEPKIINYGLSFRPLTERLRTDIIVVHHTGNPYDDDLSAKEIHRSHIVNNGWAGCGYHFIVRKNGAIEEGRPLWAMGSHAYGENWRSVGVHVCGNFEIAEPTAAQIENTAYLIGWLCDYYDLTPDAEHVVGHRDLMATACPGENLYRLLQTIRGKAIWYEQNYKEGD